MYHIDGCMTDMENVNAFFILDMQVCIILYTYAFQELLEYDPKNSLFYWVLEQKKDPNFEYILFFSENSVSK